MGAFAVGGAGKASADVSTTGQAVAAGAWGGSGSVFSAGLGGRACVAVGLDQRRRVGHHDCGRALCASALSLRVAAFQLGMGDPLPVRIVIVVTAGLAGWLVSAGQSAAG